MSEENQKSFKSVFNKVINIFSFFLKNNLHVNPVPVPMKILRDKSFRKDSFRRVYETLDILNALGLIRKISGYVFIINPNLEWICNKENGYNHSTNYRGHIQYTTKLLVLLLYYNMNQLVVDNKLGCRYLNTVLKGLEELDLISTHIIKSKKYISWKGNINFLNLQNLSVCGKSFFKDMKRFEENRICVKENSIKSIEILWKLFSSSSLDLNEDIKYFIQNKPKNYKLLLETIKMQNIKQLQTAKGKIPQTLFSYVLKYQNEKIRAKSKRTYYPEQGFNEIKIDLKQREKVFKINSNSTEIILNEFNEFDYQNNFLQQIETKMGCESEKNKENIKFKDKMALDIFNIATANQTNKFSTLKSTISNSNIFFNNSLQYSSKNNNENDNEFINQVKQAFHVNPVFKSQYILNENILNNSKMFLSSMKLTGKDESVVYNNMDQLKEENSSEFVIIDESIQYQEDVISTNHDEYDDEEMISLNENEEISKQFEEIFSLIDMNQELNEFLKNSSQNSETFKMIETERKNYEFEKVKNVKDDKLNQSNTTFEYIQSNNLNIFCNGHLDNNKYEVRNNSTRLFENGNNSFEYIESELNENERSDTDLSFTESVEFEQNRNSETESFELDINRRSQKNDSSSVENENKESGNLIMSENGLTKTTNFDLIKTNDCQDFISDMENFILKNIIEEDFNEEDLEYFEQFCQLIESE